MSVRDRILAANDIQGKQIHVDAWGVDLEVRTITAIERSRLVAMCTKEDGNVDMEKMYPLLIIAAVFDPENGEKVFSSDDMLLLQDKSASAIEFVAQEVMQMSGMLAKAVDAEGKSN